MLILCILLKVINKVKVTHQGQGHIKVKSQGQGQMRKILILLISTHLIICILLQRFNMVKVTYQGQSENFMQFYAVAYCCASGWFAFD